MSARYEIAPAVFWMGPRTGVPPRLKTEFRCRRCTLLKNFDKR